MLTRSLEIVQMRVAGVLLAAGEGSRLGQPKALVELDGMTLGERGVALLRAGGADPVLVVAGAVEVTIAAAHTVYNPDWRTGMGSSLRVALKTLTADQSSDDVANQSSDDVANQGTGQGANEGADERVGAAVIALADQPLVGPIAIARLIAAYRDGASVAVAAYDGKPLNPVLIAREHWAEVMTSATGDKGARAFLRARPELVTLVECADTGSADDIDTPEDLARIRDGNHRPF